jgi:predicted nicotinamide N-methyase
VAGHAFAVARPSRPDRLLDDAGVHAESRRDDYMPYWAYLWPGALLLAETVLREPWSAAQRRVLEIGCGLGMAGLAALAAGLQVTFSDYTAAALAAAAHNARLNGFTRFETRRIDWREPPHEPFDVVLGADVLYEARCASQVLGLLERTLGPAGLALLSDPGRPTAERFPEQAARAGFEVATESHWESLPTGRPGRSLVFRVTRLHS